MNKHTLALQSRTLCAINKGISCIAYAFITCFMLWILALIPPLHAKPTPLKDISLALSIRTMSTGEFLYADTSAINTSWNLKEVLLPGYLNKKFPFGAVQFQHTGDAEKCLMSNGFWITLGACASVKNGDYRTLFSLLPTSSGALQIQSIAAEGCLVVESSGRKITQQLQPCITDSTSPIPMRWLWILTPPNIDASIMR